MAPARSPNQISRFAASRLISSQVGCSCIAAPPLLGHMGALCRSPTVLCSMLPGEPPLDGQGAGDPVKGGALCAGRGPKAALVGREVLPAHGAVTPGQVDDAEAVIPLVMKLRR